MGTVRKSASKNAFTFLTAKASSSASGPGVARRMLLRLHARRSAGVTRPRFNCQPVDYADLFLPILM